MTVFGRSLWVADSPERSDVVTVNLAQVGNSAQPQPQVPPLMRRLSSREAETSDNMLLHARRNSTYPIRVTSLMIVLYFAAGIAGVLSSLLSQVFNCQFGACPYEEASG